VGCELLKFRCRCVAVVHHQILRMSVGQKLLGESVARFVRQRTATKPQAPDYAKGKHTFFAAARSTPS
jgi:hypothetical protein